MPPCSREVKPGGRKTQSGELIQSTIMLTPCTVSRPLCVVVKRLIGAAHAEKVIARRREVLSEVRAETSDSALAFGGWGAISQALAR